MNSQKFALTEFSEVAALRYGVCSCMAVIHQAWTFDPAGFHYWLEAQAVRDGRLRLELLREHARDVFGRASRSTRRALEWMRIDEESLEEPGPDESHTDEWYMIALAGWLDAAPSLSSNRFTGSYRVLEYVLPLAGWSKEDIRLLIFGRPLGNLVASSGVGPLVDEFRRTTLSQYGGWIDLGTAEGLLSRLTEAKDLFFSPPPEVMQESAALASWVQYPDVVLKIAHGDAQEMLQTALKRKQALFLVLD